MKHFPESTVMPSEMGKKTSLLHPVSAHELIESRGAHLQEHPGALLLRARHINLNSFNEN